MASPQEKIKKSRSIDFKHIPTGQEVSFLAFLTDFSDSYESNWNSEEVYGRMDPIMTFKNTRRKITIGWDVVAASALEAYQNMENISKLMRFQYPVYEGGRTLAAAPLIRIRFMNWVMDVSTKMGLVGTLGGMSFKPLIEEGFYDGDDGSIARSGMRDNPFKSPAGGLLPKAVALSCTFTVLHTHLMGWKLDEKDGARGNASDPFSGPGGEASQFPYGLGPPAAINAPTEGPANAAPTGAPSEVETGGQQNILEGTGGNRGYNGTGDAPRAPDYKGN